MNNLLEDIQKIKSNCLDALKIFETENIKNTFDTLEESIGKIAQSWSGSWIGYQAYTYYANFSPPASGDIFSIEWGLQSVFKHPASENWIQYNYDKVLSAILDKANISKEQVDELENSLSVSKKVFQDSRNEFITFIEIAYNENQDKLL